MEIYYVGHEGDKIDLMSDLISLPYPEELLSNSWSYSTGDRVGNSRKVQEIYKDVAEQGLTIEILADEEDEFRRLLNKIHDIFEKDIRSLEEGKIYFGEWYKECFVISKDFTNYDHLLDYIQINAKVLSTHNVWTKELTKIFEIQDDEHDTGLDYSFDYPFDYTPDGSSYAKWDTEHYAPSDFLLYVYGPCSNPVVTVNGYPYRVFTTLDTGEYFVLDSKDHTITKYLINGTTSSLYNSRQFTPSVFEQMPAGELTFAWSGDFKFSVKLFLERSEPKWHENPYLLTESGERIKTSKGYLERQSGSGSKTVSSLEELHEIEDDAVVYVVQNDGDYKARYKTVKNEKTANILPEDDIALVNVMYFLGRVEALKVGFEDGKKTGDMIYLTFESGSVDPDVAFISNNHTGLNDLNLGKNMTFELIGLWNGTKWMFAKSEVLNE